MNWIDEVQARIKRRNQILFAKDSVFLQDLASLMRGQTHRTMVLWAFGLAEEAAQTLAERYPGEPRVHEAISAAKDWAAGRIKMPVAQRAILQAHAAAKDMTSLEDIALCHAIGQACGVVHTAGHAIGFPMYELTAIIRRYGIDACKEPVEARKEQYIERLSYWRKHLASDSSRWAGFLPE